MRDFVVTINSHKINLKVYNNGTIVINDNEQNVSLSKINNHSYILKIGNKVYDITANKIDNEKYGFLIDGNYFETTVRTKLQETANELLSNKEKQSHHDIIKSPMPGLILKLKKKIGDNVEIGESVCVLEAMKMENDIRSPSSGKIKEILVKEGNSVEKNEVILKIV